jgi:hypothetical protein
MRAEDPASDATIELDLRGYRWWRVGAGGRLRSPWHGDMLWRPGLNEAACGAHRRLRDRIAGRPVHTDPVPCEGCRCGFYAVHSLPDEGKWLGLTWELRVGSSGARHALVFGVARAAGSVLLGRKGWRAQQAEVIALYAGQNTVVDLDRVRRRYGVPTYRTLEALAEEWGPAGEAETFLRSA